VRSAHVLAVRVLLLGSLLAGANCFRPQNLSGRYSCGDGGACPDGLQCDHPHNLCVSSLGGANGMGGKVGTGGTGGKGGTAGMDAGVDRPCTGAIASCQAGDAGTGICDPVCNRGCGECYQKCSVNTNGDLTCNPYPPSPPNPGPVGLLQYCSPYGTDPKVQSDNCEPGQICLNASACGVPRCYQFCRSNSDCPGGASCSRDGGSYQFCDVPPKTCNPVAGGSGSQDCNGLNCYLSQTGQGTVCDCQFNRTGLSGVGRPGDACNHSRDCLNGSVCVFLSPSLGKQCKAVCLLPVDGGAQDPCPGGCQLLQTDGGSIYGWCNN
jgi:hypothetical protein